MKIINESFPVQIRRFKKFVFSLLIPALTMHTNVTVIKQIPSHPSPEELLRPRYPPFC